MSRNIAKKNDIRTQGYVLKRTNYGEADRILNIITPFGKIVAIAKGVRKSKSKIAGGIEMFTLVDFNIHKGRSEFGIVTSAKLIKYYGEILKDYQRMELAGLILKKISQAAESSDSVEYFYITDQGLKGLNEGWNLNLIEAWFWLHLTQAMGEDVNLHRDISGKKLVVDQRYDFDSNMMAFYENEYGEYGADEIKMLRFMATAELRLAKKLKIDNEMIEKALGFARIVAHI